MGKVNEDEYKQVRVRLTTWLELDKLKRKNESFDVLVLRLLKNEWDKQDQLQEREHDESNQDRDAGSGESNGTKQRTDWGF